MPIIGLESEKLSFEKNKKKTFLTKSSKVHVPIISTRSTMVDRKVECGIHQVCMYLQIHPYCWTFCKTKTFTDWTKNCFLNIRNKKIKKKKIILTIYNFFWIKLNFKINIITLACLLCHVFCCLHVVFNYSILQRCF